MKVRVSFSVPPNAAQHVVAALLGGQELEVATWHVDEGGTLTLLDHQGKLIIAYAPGTWRTIAEVGAFKAALQVPAEPVEPPKRENPRRRQETRPPPAA